MSETEATGVRAQIAVSEPEGCPIAAASSTADAPVSDVSWSDAGSGSVTEQFRVETRDASPDGGARPVVDRDGGTVYEVEREREGCVCETIESLACPVADVRAEEGTLVVTLHLGGVDRLRAVVGELRERYDGVSVRYLARGAGDADPESLVPVDVGRLTDRQREAIETAYEMGYFEYPREANASEVAEAMDIGPSTLIEHLTAAQSKLMGDLFEH
jgi:predicted DNA binding protein